MGQPPGSVADSLEELDQSPPLRAWMTCRASGGRLESLTMPSTSSCGTPAASNAQAGWLSDGTLRMLALTLPAFLPAATAHLHGGGTRERCSSQSPRDHIQGAGCHPRGTGVYCDPLTTGGASSRCSSRYCASLETTRASTSFRGVSTPPCEDWEGVPDLASVFSSRVLG